MKPHTKEIAITIAVNTLAAASLATMFTFVLMLARLRSDEYSGLAYNAIGIGVGLAAMITAWGLYVIGRTTVHTVRVNLEYKEFLAERDLRAWRTHR